VDLSVFFSHISLQLIERYFRFVELVVASTVGFLLLYFLVLWEEPTLLLAVVGHYLHVCVGIIGLQRARKYPQQGH